MPVHTCAGSREYRDAMQYEERRIPVGFGPLSVQELPACTLEVLALYGDGHPCHQYISLKPDNLINESPSFGRI